MILRPIVTPRYFCPVSDQFTEWLLICNDGRLVVLGRPMRTAVLYVNFNAPAVEPAERQFVWQLVLVKIVERRVIGE